MPVLNNRIGEENSDERSSPGKDLIAAIALAILAIVVMAMAFVLDVPGSLFTAPGLLPFLVGATLFLMALGLGIGALRAGEGVGLIRSLQQNTAKNVDSNVDNADIAAQEQRRTLLLIFLIIAYVFLLDIMSFDWRLPTPFFEFRFSSYELVSIIALTLILRLFWRATVFYCFIISVVWIIALASVFRYGFHILLPGSD